MNGILRVIGLALLGILLTGGILSSFYVHSIEAALSLPANDNGANINLPTSATSVTIATTATSATNTPGKVADPVVTNILSQDTFQRPDQLFWGRASDGHLWGADAITRNAFSIAGRTGEVANGHGAFDATIGQPITDAEVEFSGSISQFAQSNIGAVLRWADTNDWYKSYIDGSNLVVLKRVAGMATRLGAFPFTAKAGVLYTMRFRIKGTALSAKVWQQGSIEPANWMITVTDDTFQSGYGGLRILLENGIVAKITSFKETAITANS
ncbi:MAG TPA: hypothetical protein VEL69_07320 [Ktedonobacteraceae bacterium]|nr:hypothetical protein [Ktedonobacteraceae bacterium]